MAEIVGEIDQKIESNERLKSKRKGSVQTIPPSSLRTVLKHSDGLDMLLMALGTIGCVADGACMSAIMLVLANLMNGYAAATSLTPKVINKYAVSLLYVAIGVGIGGFLEGFCWARTAERQTSCSRTRYLQAVLREEIPNFMMNIAMFITAQMAALYLCWRLAIVGIPALLMLIIPGLVYGKLLSDVGEKIQEAYGVAGGIAEQALSSVRTVYSYVREEKTAQNYSAALKPTLKLGFKQGLLKGMAIGSVGIGYGVWALQGWYGSILVTEKNLKGGNIFTAGVCIIYGGFALGSCLINVMHFMHANVAAAQIFEMIERVPNIDSADQQGKIMSDVKGELEFKDIYFVYPSRPESKVLQNFNLRVDACQTVGLVGGSGSGKSTVINLLERFYDPLEGDLLLDGISIKTLQLKWLRSQMGLVNQEPLVFATSIKENILFGKEEASEEEIVQAAKAANAHDFITQLPNGYDTQVGQLGIKMSVGQKQRISIARALLRDPKILLLDEATSSLDSQSEKAVQDALNQASIGRTTIVIAHCLSTLRDAELIAVIQSGQVVECGSHDQLVQNIHGPYSAMVQLQRAFMNDKTVAPSEAIESNKSSS
ncbi:ABC transporter B family member 17 [Camellia lanceoleosa]|uniref:ABC transporter B family member 17 n=1 Tax=Camellia lanceoleosa TaxID=1840588 RepID=A0ACC0I6W6_9ERIC|nr:ABC transporter B family member 17 [Camellia lanceoleosa]